MGGAAGAECALCGADAAVHCEADAAFLCAACDAKVHGANFLASRHRRRRVVTGGMLAADEEGYESETSAAASSASCVSTADSASTAAVAAPRGRMRPGARAEVVLEGWAKRMGLASGAARRRAAAAGRALRACGPDVAAARVPLRVAMAAALWWEVAGHGAGASQGDALRRLEACAHVPARLLAAVASSMARARARRRAVVDSAEGWDECS